MKSDGVRVTPLKVCVLGFGAIGRTLCGSITADPRYSLSVLLRGNAPESKIAEARLHGSIFTSVAEMIASAPDVLVECAGHEALQSAAVPALRSGVDVICASVGALSDPTLESKLRAAAADGGRLHIPSGAIAGLDALSAIEDFQQVRYTGIKNSSAWVGTAAESIVDLRALKEPTMFFRGSAREAARKFPKNANVVAAVALASAGFEITLAELWADPSSKENEHRIHASGPFGTLEIKVSNRPMATNPKTSALTAMSITRTLERLVDKVVI